MQESEQRYEEGREQDERPDLHGRTGHRPRDETGKCTGRQGRRARGDDEVEQPEQVPDDEAAALGEVGLAREFEGDERRGEADGDVAEPRGPGEQARQHAVGIEHEESEANHAPALQHGDDAHVTGEHEVAECRRAGVKREERGDRHDHRDEHRTEQLVRSGGGEPRDSNRGGEREPRGENERDRGARRNAERCAR